MHECPYTDLTCKIAQDGGIHESCGGHWFAFTISSRWAWKAECWWRMQVDFRELQRCRHVGYISSMDVSCMQAAEARVSYHLAHVKSELHSLVSCVCDGIFIKACATFVLDEPLEHVRFTDSSSARQLASRQGSGKIRHLAENCCGYRRKQLTTPSNFDRFQRHSMWQTLEQRL